MNIKNLSNEMLLSQTKNLVQKERELLLDIIYHLKEIDSRRLYLKIGYASLWAYCAKELNYSEASAQRRIEAMRALRELPVLAEKIESGALSLSSVAKAQSVVRKAERQSPELKLDETQKLELFSQLENNSQRETGSKQSAGPAVTKTARRIVWQKARGVCEYIDASSGRRCSSSHQLEIEHVKPRAFGGGNELKNLKLFCRAHNQQAAREMGLIVSDTK